MIASFKRSTVWPSDNAPPAVFEACDFGRDLITPAADGPRYRAIGNSWAIPPVHWIGRRIKQQIT